MWLMPRMSLSVSFFSVVTSTLSRMFTIHAGRRDAQRDLLKMREHAVASVPRQFVRLEGVVFKQVFGLYGAPTDRQ